MAAERQPLQKVNPLGGPRSFKSHPKAFSLAVLGGGPKARGSFWEPPGSGLQCTLLKGDQPVYPAKRTEREMDRR